MSHPDDKTLSDDTVADLDHYLAQLQAGQATDRQGFLKRFPQLAGAVEALEALEKLAPPCDESLPTETIGPEQAPGPATSLTPLAGDTVAQLQAAIGFDFGAYEVECELGRGGMGVVFKARHKALKRPVALKMILSGQLASADLLSRFQDEARAAAALHHPHIVGVYEAGQLQGQPFFAMQYISGPSLSKRLEVGPLEPDAAARLVQQVAEAVAHLHQHDIVHRDLKPSNILLDDQGCPYVTDFGLVKLLTGDSHRTSTGVIVGTPSYMAPEQASSQAERVGPLSDVYSLGAILYECLVGRPPFREATPLDTLVQVLEGEPKPLRDHKPGIPRELELICLRCLEKDPAQRYASAAALASDLEKFLKREVLDVRAPGWGQRLKRWTRREPALVSRLVTLGFGIIIANVSFQISHRVTLQLHSQIVAILVGWAAMSAVCQRLLYVAAWQRVIPYAWSALDLVFFTGLLYLDDALNKPIIIGYPLLVAASGLWFRIALIWFTTASAGLSYAILYLLYLRTGELYGIHQHIIFLIGLAVLGGIVAYQVNRVRALSRYYEHRPLP